MFRVGLCLHTTSRMELGIWRTPCAKKLCLFYQHVGLNGVRGCGARCALVISHRMDDNSYIFQSIDFVRSESGKSLTTYDLSCVVRQSHTDPLVICLI